MKDLRQIKRIIAASVGAVCTVLLITHLYLLASRLNESEPVTETSDALIPPGPERQTDVPENLRAAINRGKAQLMTEKLDPAKCGGSGTGMERCVSDYLLAAVNTDGDLAIVRVYQGRPSEPKGYTVEVEDPSSKKQGVNVPFTLSAPPGWTVVALKTAVPRGDSVSTPIYVPYATRINTTEMRTSGVMYLEQIVHTAGTELDVSKVRSRHHSGKLVTDVAEERHVITLILTEQIKSDHDFAMGDARTRLEMLNRTLVLIGANRDQAYAYQGKSGTGALGLAQLMPDTYDALRAEYPEASLLENRTLGRLDHSMSVKAAFLHTDNEWWAFEKNPPRKAWLIKNLPDQRLVLAAGYNANIKTVENAIQECEDKWRTCKELPLETQWYIIKYAWIRGILYNPAFRERVQHELNKTASL